MLFRSRGKKIGDKLPAAPVRAGYEFEGWSTESSFGTVNVTKDTVINNDTLIYAVFKKQGAIVKQVSSITLGVTKSNIKAGDEADVIASILPADADDKRLSWESSAPDKLKIEQTGDNFIRVFGSMSSCGSLSFSVTLMVTVLCRLP